MERAFEKASKILVFCIFSSVVDTRVFFLLFFKTCTYHSYMRISQLKFLLNIQCDFKDSPYKIVRVSKF